MDKIASIDEISVGMTETSERIISESDINSFADISGDHNLVHLDENFAKNTIFKKRIAHGFLSASMFSGIFGTKLQGFGSVYLSQILKFKKTLYIGDKVIAKVEVIKINKKVSKVFFRTTCSVNQNIVIDGEAEIYIITS